MSYFKIIFCTLFLSLGFSKFSFAEVVVIVNPDNHIVIDAKKIRSIFLGKIKTFSNGEEVKPLDLLDGEAGKSEFIQKVLRKTSSSLNSHWSRMIFSSKGRPPIELSTVKMKEAVASNKNAIGYIDSKDIDDSVKILLIF